MAIDRAKEALGVFRRLGIVRAADLQACDIPRAEIYRLVRRGLIERRARGIYVAATHPITAEHTLAQVAKRIPGGVFCLLSALFPQGAGAAGNGLKFWQTGNVQIYAAGLFVGIAVFVGVFLIRG